MSADGASTASSALSSAASAEASASSALILSMSSESAASPSSPVSSLLLVLVAVLAVLLLVGRRCGPRPCRATSSRSWTASPNLRWSSISRVELVEIAAGAVLDERPPQVDELLAPPPAAAGRSAARAPSWRRASSIGASARSVISSNLPRWKRSSSIAGEIAWRRRPCAARRSPRRGPARPRRTPRAPAGRRAPGGDARGIVAGELQRDRVGMAAHDRGLLAGQLARRLRQPRLAADQAGPLGGEGDFELGLAGDGAQAAGDRALERLGRGFLGGRLGLAVGGHGRSISPVFRSSFRDGRSPAPESRCTFSVESWIPGSAPRTRPGMTCNQLSATLTALSGSSWPKQR